jgi:hypothetical protein
MNARQLDAHACQNINHASLGLSALTRQSYRRPSRRKCAYALDFMLAAAAPAHSIDFTQLIIDLEVKPVKDGDVIQRKPQTILGPLTTG